MAGAAQPSAAAEAKAEVLTREVARGRTVIVDGKVKAAGSEVTLPADEVERLTRHGFLVDPDAEILPEGTGPKFERR